MRYYKLRQIYYNLQQNSITNYDRFITNYDSVLLQITVALLQITVKCYYNFIKVIIISCGKCYYRSFITEDQAVGELFNKFFINVAPNLKISTDHGYDNDQVTNAVNKFRNHSNIIMIKNKKKMTKFFPSVP